MENSQNARYAQYPEKNDYFLDPNQTLTKEKIQEAFAKSKLLKNQSNSNFSKENINLNIIPPKKTKKENSKMDIESIEGQKSIDLIASTSTKYSSTNNSKISIESNNNQISYGTNLIFHAVKNSNNKINISPQKIFDYNFKSNSDYISYTGEYLDEIYNNLLSDEKELKYCPKIGYMTLQGDINEQMRAILIDWLVEVHYRFRLKSETLFQTVWIIDTYLSMVQITRAKLQLLGIASLLISCKSNEIYYPQLNEFTDITDGAYVKNELIEMEKKVLKILNFNIIAPTSNDFYNIISKAFCFDEKQFYLGKYFLESTLIDYRMIKYNPSVIGVSCAYIVMKFFGINNYKILYKNEVVNDPCPQKIIKEAARDICSLVKNLAESTLKAVKDKYCLSQFLNVAQLCEQN
jgi:cyclin B